MKRCVRSQTLDAHDISVDCLRPVLVAVAACPARGSWTGVRPVIQPTTFTVFHRLLLGETHSLEGCANVLSLLGHLRLLQAVPPALLGMVMPLAAVFKPVPHAFAARCSCRG